MELTINERKSMSSKSNPESSLPPGFRFHPTDEELILHYLRNKVTTTMFPVSIIAEVDIYKFDPWDLPEKAVFGEKEWYFFSHRDRKYPNGARPNRAAVSGYWKATGTDKMIVGGGTIDEEMMKIGVKKALVFYTGKPPKGVKTNWIMHEYRLSENPNNNNIKPINPKHSTRLEDWVLCRIYKKSNSLPSMTTTEKEEEYEPLIQDDLQPTFPSLLPNQYNLKPQKSSSFSDLLRVMDYSILTSLMSDGNPSNSNGWNNQNQSIFNNNINNSLPRLDSSVSPVIENQLKRQHSSMDEGVGVGLFHPSKKLNNSCNFTNENNQLDTYQYQLTNQPILNQHLRFSSHLQFQRWMNKLCCVM